MQITNQLPTLGYMHKVVCDCLGLWGSDNDEVTFNVAATEKDRRIALRKAFDAIKKEDGTYGSSEDLIAVTIQLAPKDTQRVKKNRTIQAYVSHFSKTDFESDDEYHELQQYIEALLVERYSGWGVSELAVSFYFSALGHYREFVREYACNAKSQMYSFQCFLSQDLRALSTTLTRKFLSEDAWTDAALNEPWPLKRFAEDACRLAGVSQHKLHQYHEFQQEDPLREQAWTRDFAGQHVNTRSKQVIDRLRKPSRMKWETFYPTLQPLTDLLPKSVSEKVFANHAFAAMIAHNLNVNVSVLGPFTPPVRGPLTNDQEKHRHSCPSSDLMDLQINGYPIPNESFAQLAPHRYQVLLEWIRSLPGSLNFSADIPGNAALSYTSEHRRFAEGSWRIGLEDAPSWLIEWANAREAMLARDSLQALTHFKSALSQARYVAGPLFISFYIEVCAFCKSQYRRLSEGNESEVFGRLYEGLGVDASKYAKLMGYTSQYVRDPDTLMPRAMLPLKERWIIGEIDAYAKKLCG